MCVLYSTIRINLLLIVDYHLVYPLFHYQDLNSGFRQFFLFNSTPVMNFSSPSFQ